MADRDPLEELRRILRTSPVLLRITLKALAVLRPPPPAESPLPERPPTIH